MTLIKSISGIRGTIGGAVGENLTPPDVVKFVSSYGVWLAKRCGKDFVRVVVGRDARLSGELISNLVTSTLSSLGHTPINIGMATTPTTEMAVVAEGADGGIIITASHNPEEWNALKLLNSDGEFLSAADGAELLELAERGDFNYAGVKNIGSIESRDYTAYHIDEVLKLPLVDREAIAKRGLKVVVDGVNSIGGVVIPKLLETLGVESIVTLNCEPTGHFAHNPEPIPANLNQISEEVRRSGADLGIVVDPDVDRLALICENGEMFGEEYTLVAVADYILQRTPGNTVSNLSSSRALRDVTAKYAGSSYSAAAVGEVNVVAEMKRVGAIIGGEGNGGVIYPALHYGRDALVGVALFLSLYVESGKKMSALRDSYPQYYISKNRIETTPEMDVERVFEELKRSYSGEQITDIDGVKIDFKDGWVHLRRSNTEPIVRVYSEAHTKEEAERLAEKVIATFHSVVR